METCSDGREWNVEDCGEVRTWGSRFGKAALALLPVCRDPLGRRFGGHGAPAPIPQMANVASQNTPNGRAISFALSTSVTFSYIPIRPICSLPRASSSSTSILTGSLDWAHNCRCSNDILLRNAMNLKLECSLDIPRRLLYFYCSKAQISFAYNLQFFLKKEKAP